MRKIIIFLIMNIIFIFSLNLVILPQDFSIKGITFVKHKPAQDGLILGVIKKETQVTLLAEKDGWSKVQLENGIVGWVPNEKLIKSSRVLTAAAKPVVKDTQKPVFEPKTTYPEESAESVDLVDTEADSPEVFFQPSQLSLPVKKPAKMETSASTRFSIWPYLPSLGLLILLFLLWRNSKRLSERLVRNVVNQEIKRQAEVFKTNVEEKQSYLIHQMSVLEQNIATETDRLTQRQERMESRMKKLVSHELPTVFHNLKETLNKILSQQGQQIEKLDQKIQAQAAAQTFAPITAASGRSDRSNDKHARIDKTKSSDGRKAKPSSDEVVIVKTSS